METASSSPTAKQLNQVGRLIAKLVDIAPQMEAHLSKDYTPSTCFGHEQTGDFPSDSESPEYWLQPFTTPELGAAGELLEAIGTLHDDVPASFELADWIAVLGSEARQRVSGELLAATGF